MYMRQFQSPSRLIVSAILRPPARHLHLFSLHCITVHIHSSGPAITAQPEINHTHLFQTLKRLLIIYQNGFSLTEWNSLHPGYLQLGYMCRPQQQVNTPPPVKARGLSLRENQRSTWQSDNAAEKLEHTIYESAHTISPRVNFGIAWNPSARFSQRMRASTGTSALETECNH